MNKDEEQFLFMSMLRGYVIYSFEYLDISIVFKIAKAITTKLLDVKYVYLL